MSETITCIEADGRPPRVSLPLEGKDFLVWLLPDALEGSGPLRNTILRRQGEAPPAGSLLVLWVDVQVLGSKRISTRVRRVGSEVKVHLRDTDTWRELAPGTALPPDADYEVQLPTQRRFRFSLRRSNLGAGTMASAVAGSGTSTAKGKVAERGALWLVPTVWTVLMDQQQFVMNNIRAILRRLGLGPQATRYLFVMVAFLAAAGIAFYTQYKAKAEAESRAEEAEEAMARADAAREASLLGEMTCLVERQKLVEKLGTIDEQRMLLVENVLDVTDARSAAVDVAGGRMSGDDLMALDMAAADHMKTYVVSLMGVLPAPDPSDTVPCLDQDPVMGEDLPRYALLWHPDPELVCPLSYVGLVDGLTLAGRWGLSPRVAGEFGQPEPALAGAAADGALAELMSDPRMNDRWSADTLAEGLRTVQETLLEFQIEGRPSVLPSQSQAWSLALLSAVNRLPSKADGVLNEPASFCVTQVLTEYAGSAPASQKGEPLLPDLVDVATGEVALKVRPSPSCPWATDAMKKGATDAFHAATRLALIDEAGGDAALAP